MSRQISESKFSEKLVAELKKYRTVFNISGGPLQKRGIPDLYVTPNIWLELKVGDNKPTKLQKLTLLDLKKEGCSAYVLRERLGYVTLESADGSEIYYWKVTRLFMKQVHLFLLLFGGRV